MMMPKRKQAEAPPPPLKPQDSARKRTPQSAFEAAAGKDIYEPEKVVAQRIAKGGVTQFLVKWAGYEPKHNTWEPLEPFSTVGSFFSLFAAFNTM
jgi:hypothetical protein